MCRILSISLPKCLLAAGLLFHTACSAQICSPDIFFHHYQGNAAVYTYKVITTAQNDVLSVGAVLKLNGDFLDATDGWLTKLSARGTVLWSKRYFVPGFNSGGFLSVENATDSTYLVTARFGKYKKRFDGSMEELDAATFLIHIDKFGNVIWVKRMNNYINDSILSSITRLQDNSFLIAGTIIKSSILKMLLLNINLAGNVWWSKIMYVDSSTFGSPFVKQLNNGLVVIAGLNFRSGPNYSSFSDMGWYLYKIDPLTGSMLRSSGIYSKRGPTSQPVPLENINEILELPNDTLVLATSFSGTQYYGITPGSRQGLLIKAGTNGQFYKADGYYNTVPGCRLMDAQYINGTYRLLLEDGYKTLYAELNKGGEITSQKAYGNVYSLLQGYKLIDGDPAIRSFFTGRGQYALLGLMKTEGDGSINCMGTPSQLIKEPVTTAFTTGNLQLQYIPPSYPFVFDNLGQSVSWAYYNFTKATDCIVTCCDNIRSDTTHREFCNQSSYRLPDNSVVRENGLYYVNTKNANNCDSTAYYDLKFSFKPSIDLGADTCFINQQPIVLKADSGYASYTWMGINSTSHIYTATRPGKYNVSITNLCGTGVDEIEIFDECEFPVYMPSGFTPNNDGLNDIYSYPPQNRNRFLSLRIFNRFGQQVFETATPGRGWNGKFKNLEQATGVYVYILQLLTLDGRKTLKKGTFALIR